MAHLSGGGKTIYFEGVSCGLRPKAGGGLSPEAAAPSSPAKKGRTGVVPGAQPPRCQVEGCMVDLSDAKAYYCRHKVCGVHSKSPKVIVAGIEQRFCQQCSRFHQLSEFDQGKRSCRRRLAGHNERRRKPPPGPLLSSRYGTLSPSTLDNRSVTGGFVMDFSAYSNLARRDRSWANTNLEQGFENNLTGKHQQLPWQSSSYNQPPPLPPHSYAEPEQACFSGASESSSALSLLSNHPTDLGVNTFPAAATNDSTPSAQPPNNIGHFSCPPSWGFTNQGNSNNATHEMHADMGLAQISHEAQYGGTLELAQPSHGQYEVEASSGYDSCTQHMHWSL